MKSENRFFFFKTEAAIFFLSKDHIIEKDDKIIGGKEVLRTYPYQVSLQLENENTYSLFGRRDFVHNCGGAIVSDNCVLTAAHCVTNYQPRDLSILAGTDKLSGGDGLRYFVRDVQIHPNYKEFVTSDIAITRIFGKFDYSERIAPIKYSNDTIGGYYNCTLTGWGFTNPVLPSQPNDLQRVFLSTITNHECNDYGMTVTNTEICTYPYVGKGACNVLFYFIFI